MEYETKQKIWAGVVLCGILSIPVLLIYGSIYMGIQTESERHVCAEKMDNEYSFWNGFEGEDLRYKYLTNESFACCTSERWINSQGGYEELKCKEFKLNEVN